MKAVFLRSSEKSKRVQRPVTQVLRINEKGTLESVPEVTLKSGTLVRYRILGGGGLVVPGGELRCWSAFDSRGFR